MGFLKVCKILHTCEIIEYNCKYINIIAKLKTDMRGPDIHYGIRVALK